MSTAAFDAFTRQTAHAISRRRSLVTLGGAGAVMAALAHPVVTTAKKGGTKKRKRKKNDPFKQCKRQARKCKEIVEESCEEDNCNPERLEGQLECCEFLATCRADEFLGCID